MVSISAGAGIGFFLIRCDPFCESVWLSEGCLSRCTSNQQIHTLLVEFPENPDSRVREQTIVLCFFSIISSFADSPTRANQDSQDQAVPVGSFSRSGNTVRRSPRMRFST